MPCNRLKAFQHINKYVHNRYNVRSNIFYIVHYIKMQMDAHFIIYSCVLPSYHLSSRSFWSYMQSRYETKCDLCAAADQLIPSVNRNLQEQFQTLPGSASTITHWLARSASITDQVIDRAGGVNVNVIAMRARLIKA